MSMRLDILRARYGDCLFLTIEGDAEDQPIRLLIDGGPPTVYEKALKPYLLEKAGPDPEGALVIDAAMVSHIDQDHIKGVLDLFAELRDAEIKRRNAPFAVRALLHNSLDSLLAESEGGIARRAKIDSILASIDPGMPGMELDGDAARILQSYAEGTSLSSIAARLGIVRNPPDEGVIALGRDKGTDPNKLLPRKFMLGDATMEIFGPMWPEVDKLRTEWKTYVATKQSAKNRDEAEQALKTLTAAIKDDKSVPNLSSIVALIERAGRTILLTGDALGDKIVEGLEKAGKFPAGGNGVLHVDVLKLPHHGSVRNVGALFDRVHADCYIASGDGTYGNPDLATLKLLKSARPKGGFELILTYSAKECDAQHQEWLKNRKKKVGEEFEGISKFIADWKGIEIKDGLQPGKKWHSVTLSEAGKDAASKVPQPSRNTALPKHGSISLRRPSPKPKG